VIWSQEKNSAPGKIVFFFENITIINYQTFTTNKVSLVTTNFNIKVGKVLLADLTEWYRQELATLTKTGITA